MLPVNNMAYGSDSFNFTKRALLRSKTCWDLTGETSCAGFEISGTEEDGTKRRIIFELDDGKLYKFGNAGLVEYEERGEFEDIIEGGNTVAELLNLSSIPAFCNRKIYPIVALQADETAQVMPRIKLKLKVNCFNDRYSFNEYSPIYNLTDNAKISDVIADTFTNGNATVTIYARIFNPANNSWSDWDFYPNFKNKAASKIQYRNNYVLTTLDGSDFARVNAIRCFYTTDKDKISAASQELITAPQDFYADLKTCYVLVKHSEIVDAEIKCYVLQTPRGETFENVMIGTATGENQSLYLQSGGVIFPSPSGIHLFKGSNGQPITDFYFDTENSTVSPPPVGDIYASWTAGTGDEVWQEMLQDSADFNSSRFTYRATDSANKKVVAVKIVLTRQGDTVSDVQIGTGTGKLQTFALPHKAKAETLSCTAPFKYDEDAQILKTNAGIAESISVGYSWQGEVPKIKEIICGWSV